MPSQLGGLLAIPGTGPSSYPFTLSGRQTSILLAARRNCCTWLVYCNYIQPLSLVEGENNIHCISRCWICPAFAKINSDQKMKLKVSQFTQSNSFMMTISFQLKIFHCLQKEGESGGLLAVTENQKREWESSLPSEDESP